MCRCFQNMSDSDSFIEELNWKCNNPTNYEIRFNDEDDVLSSDNSDIEENHSHKAKKYNQLLPRGKTVYKLLHSAKPEWNKSWLTIEEKVDLLKKYATGDESRFANYSGIISSDSSDTGGSYSGKTSRKNQPQIRQKGNTFAQTVESKVDFLETFTESDLETISSENMAKSSKRKREESITDDVEDGRSKKKRTNADESGVKSVKRRERRHSVSSSEGEDLSSAKIQSKSHDKKSKSNKNSLNTHLLSSESDIEADLSYDSSPRKVTSEKTVSKNGDISDSDHESTLDVEEEVSHIEEAVVGVSASADSIKQLHRIPKFTHEFNEDISKFSELLDDRLIEKNDIWILQCPSNLDCSALVNQRLSLSGSCRLDDGERTYEAYSYCNPGTRTATLAVPNERNQFKLSRIPIIGNIIVEESVKVSKDTSPNEIISESPSRVEFPENLRTRHPLLGTEFSKQPPRTAERVDESPRKKKKKHSKISGESYNDHAEQPVEESFSESVGQKKKKKKHKDN